MSYRIFDEGTVTYTGIGQPRNVATRRYVVLHEVDGRPPIVIVTERRDDQGVSITNAAENVRAALTKQLRTASFRLVEHYEGRSDGGVFGETFDWVYFTDAGRPVWKPLETGDRSRAALARLLDGDTDLADEAVAL